MGSDVTDQQQEAVDALLELFPVIDFNADMAAAYGRTVSKAGFNRHKIIDRMIAATATVKRLSLVTSNDSDFADIDALKLECWAA